MMLDKISLRNDWIELQWFIKNRVQPELYIGLSVRFGSDFANRIQNRPKYNFKLSKCLIYWKKIKIRSDTIFSFRFVGSVRQTKPNQTEKPFLFGLVRFNACFVLFRRYLHFLRLPFFTSVFSHFFTDVKNGRKKYN